MPLPYETPAYPTAAFDHATVAECVVGGTAPMGDPVLLRQAVGSPRGSGVLGGGRRACQRGRSWLPTRPRVHRASALSAKEQAQHRSASSRLDDTSSTGAKPSSEGGR